MSSNRSNVISLLDPKNARFNGQEKVNAEIFTALEMLGRKLERTEAERDRLADRLEMLESGATLDEETGKIYLPVVIDEKSRKKLASGNSTFLTLSSMVSSVFAIAAFAIVMVQNPDLTMNKIAELKELYQNSGLTPIEKTLLPNESNETVSTNTEEDTLANNENEEAATAVEEEIADINDFKKDDTSEVVVKDIAEEPVKPAPTAVEEIKVEVKTTAINNKVDNIPVVSTVAPVIDTVTPEVKAEIKPEVNVAIKSSVVTDSVEGISNDLPTDGNLTGDLKQLEQAAYSGVPEAQHDLGVFYAEGNVVKQDYDRSVYWLNKAALNGVANANYNLAVMYQQGIGVKKDFAEALKYYEYAVELGHPEAMYNMGIIYFTGNGTEKNLSKGLGYFKRAANMGVIEAAYNLGVLYESDVIGKSDMAKAKEWYKVAADKGYKQAEDALKRIDNSVYTKESISKVEKAEKADNILNR